MPISRRSFVHAATLTILAGSVLPSASSQSKPTTKGKPLHFGDPVDFTGASSQSFEPFVGKSFALFSGEKPAGSVRLSAVENLSPARNPDSARFMVGRAPATPTEQPISCFALRFQGQGKALPQNTYTLRNPEIGSMVLFLAPTGEEQNSANYTAFFSLFETA